MRNSTDLARAVNRLASVIQLLGLLLWSAIICHACVTAAHH